MSEQPYTDQQIQDASITAMLRALERHGHARAVLADMTDQEQADVFAAEARNAKGRRK